MQCTRHAVEPVHVAHSLLQGATFQAPGRPGYAGALQHRPCCAATLAAIWIWAASWTGQQHTTHWAS